MIAKLETSFIRKFVLSLCHFHSLFHMHDFANGLFIFVLNIPSTNARCSIRGYRAAVVSSSASQTVFTKCHKVVGLLDYYLVRLQSFAF